MIVLSSSQGQLSLPSPQLGDQEIIDLRVNISRMMDGTIITYILGQPTHILELDFKFANRPKIIEAITWLTASAGEEIQYSDYETPPQLWIGKITNFPFEAVHTAIRNNAFHLTFEGRQV